VIKLSREAAQRAADLGAEFLRKMIDARIDARGNPLPPGVTLYKTGAMYRSIHGEVTAGGIPVVVVSAPYAWFVNKHYAFNAIAPQFTEEFYRLLQPIFAGGLTLER
jgi:hypothetical protein